MENESLKIKFEKFFGENYHFIWNDGWYIDGDDIWFAAGAMNILFCMDRKNGKIILAERIPSDTICEMRLHPRCIKQGDSIFCLPDRGQNIWRYCLSNFGWEQISIQNPYKQRIRCSNAWIIGRKLYIVAAGLKQILELDLESNTIENYYDLVSDQEVSLTGCVLVNDCIYIEKAYPPGIYKFDCMNKTIHIFDLSEIQDYLETISYDGDRFWLSGHCKKIYLWEQNKGVSILDKFPSDFRVYNFDENYKKTSEKKREKAHWFGISVFVAHCVWFIPYHASDILYVNIDTLEINRFSIVEEIQMQKDIGKEILGHKYLLQYISEDRYIGLFSLKNKWIFEIDCVKLIYRILNCQLDMETLDYINKEIIFDNFCQSGIKCENKEYNLKLLIRYFLMNENDDRIDNKKEKVTNTIGENIYNMSV